MAKQRSFTDFHYDSYYNFYFACESWTPISRQSAENLYGLPANVFGIVQGEKLRLVAHLRKVTMFLTASADMPSLYGGIPQLSLTDFGETIVADCSSAIFDTAIGGYRYFRLTTLPQGWKWPPLFFRIAITFIITKLEKLVAKD
jgi:hypothetical protein